MKSLGFVFLLGSIVTTSAFAQTPRVATPAPVERAWASPAEQFNATLAAVRGNHLGQLIRVAMSERLYASLRDDWNEQRAKPKTKSPNEAQAQTPSLDPAYVWAQLQTDEGTNQLAEQWRQQLTRTAQGQVLAFNLALGAMWEHQANLDTRTADEQAMERDVMRAIQAWGARTDFGDANKIRVVAQAMAKEVRATGAKSLDDFMALPFDKAIEHGDGLLRVARLALNTYGLAIDDTLTATRIQETKRKGPRVTVSFDTKLIDTPIRWDNDYLPFAGGWALAGSVEALPRNQAPATQH